MKKHILVTFTILFAVIISLFGMVAFASYFGGVSEESDQVLSNVVAQTVGEEDGTMTEPISLKPKFYALIPGESGNIRYNFPNDKIVYHGIKNKADYRVEWEGNPDLNIDYTLNFYDQEGNPLPEEGGDRLPWKAGTYTIQVAINDPHYKVEEADRVCEMTITPFVCHLVSVSATTKIYDGLYFNPTIKLKESILPDEKAYSIQYYEKVGETYQPMTGQPINVGEYKVSLEFANDDGNYIYEFDDKEWNGVFQITPRQLTVDYIVDNSTWNKPNPITYSGKAKDIQPVVRGWRTNAALQKSDEDIFAKECSVEITQNGKVTPAYRVGKYTLTIKSNVQLTNYILPPTDELEISKKRVDFAFKLPANLVYDGGRKIAEPVTQDICEGDDVVATILYNGSEDAPINAGEYKFSIRVQGNDMDNYTFGYDEQAKMTIAKAEYPTTDFTVVAYSNKIVITVDKPVGCDSVMYTIAEDIWTTSNEIAVGAMQDYLVKVKLVESANYKEKILSKTVKTGFDSNIFGGLLTKVDTDNFSFKDISTYLEIERCFGYVSDTDIANIDMQKLEKIRALYSEYKSNAQSVVQDAADFGSAMSLSVSVALSCVAGVGICMGILVTRRKKDAN